MTQTLSPKQVARALGVSESSLKRWCDRGLIRSTKTSGGHRRLAIDAVLHFVRETGHDLAHPELLDLPARTGSSPRTLERARHDFLNAILSGDEQRCRLIILDLHLAGISLSQIGDEIVARAFHCLGDCWERGETEIYCERRAVETCARALHEIRQTLPPPAQNALQAIGAAPECDPYSMPTRLVELVLRQRGWAAQSLGSRLPFQTLVRAVDDLEPQLFWLSVSHLDNAEQFVAGYREFYASVKEKTRVVVGGRALTDAIRGQIRYAAFCDNLQHLEGFLAALAPVPTLPEAATGAPDQATAGTVD